MERRMDRQMGTVEGSLGFTVSSSSDQGYYELDRNLKRRVKRGDVVVFDETGKVNVVDREEVRRQRQIARQTLQGKDVTAVETSAVAAGTFPWITENVDALVTILRIGERTIRLIDVSGVAPFGNLQRKLNGSMSKTDTLIRKSIAKGVLEGGVMPGVQIFREKDRRELKIFGVQDGDPNERTRLCAAFTPLDINSSTYIVAGFQYEDYRRASRFLKAARYVSSVSSGKGN